MLGDVSIPLDLCPLNKPALWYEHIGKLENTINGHVCWGDTHMHTCTETKTSPECMCFPIMYCSSVSWEASVGARGLCEEMGLWEQSSSGWEQCYTSAEWQTARPAGWAPSQRDLSKKQDRRLLRSHTWGFPVPAHTWTNTPAHREKVLISPITGRYRTRSVRQWALITQWACLLCDHPAFRMAKIKLLFFMVFCYAACMDWISQFNSDCSQHLDKHPSDILMQKCIYLGIYWENSAFIHVYIQALLKGKDCVFCLYISVVS